MEKVTVAELLPALGKTDFKLDDQPYSSLFKIYQKEFLDISVSKGLIYTNVLALAGDGTPVVTSHRERKKRNCKEKGITDCKCDRYFSQPDCDIGWDSSRDCFIMVTTCTCLSIPRVTYLCSRIFHMLQNTIPTNFCMLISE